MEAKARGSGDGEVRLEAEPVWPVVLFRGARDNEAKARTWDALTMCRALAVHREWTGEKVNAPAWSPVVMRSGVTRRAKKNVEAVSMLVLDCDAGDALEELEGLGRDFYRLGHTSWSHTTDYPKARLVFPFVPGAFCPVDEWGAVWAAAARWASHHGVTVDPAAKDPSRLYFGPYHAPDIVAREEAVAWVYGPGMMAGGILEDRPSRFLSWAWLVSEWGAADDEEGPLDIVKSTAGSWDDSNERHARRRRAFGAGLIRSRATKLAQSGKGGRNSSLYGAARLVAQLEAAGAVHAADALEELRAAALVAGLGAQEVKRTLSSGYTTGRKDLAYPVDKEMGQ